MGYATMHRAALYAAAAFALALALGGGAAYLRDRTGLLPIVIMGALMLAPALLYRARRFDAPGPEDAP